VENPIMQYICFIKMTIDTICIIFASRVIMQIYRIIEEGRLTNM
jgi:hypothetical protein